MVTTRATLFEIRIAPEFLIQHDLKPPPVLQISSSVQSRADGCKALLGSRVWITGIPLPLGGTRRPECNPGDVAAPDAT